MTREPDYEGAFHFMAGYIRLSNEMGVTVDATKLFQAAYYYHGVLPIPSMIKALNLKINNNAK